MTRAEQILEKLTRQMIARFGTKKDKKKLYRKDEVAPPGFEGTVKALKKRHSDEVDNPWALSWWMKNQGYKSHKKKTGGPKDESREGADLAYGMYDRGPLAKKKKKNEKLDPLHPAVQMSRKIPASQKRVKR